MSNGVGNFFLSENAKQNILSFNPEITFFKKVFVRHTNFAQETLNIPISSDLADFDKEFSINIDKNADLLGQITLKIVLPSISESINSDLPRGIKKFRWINKVGFGIIDYIDLKIGSLLIDKHYGDWINIYHELFRGYDKDLEKLIGYNNKKMNEYSISKESFTLYVPLKFFFNLSPNFYLPLISITLQDITLNIRFKSFEKCFNESPTNYFEINENVCLLQENEYIFQEIESKKAIGIFRYFDLDNKRVYYDKVLHDFQILTSDNYNIIGDISKYVVKPKNNSIIYNDNLYFKTTDIPPVREASLLINYIYLDNNESWYFQNNKLSYNIPLIYNSIEKTLNNLKNKVSIVVKNPSKVIFWRGLLKSNEERNDFFNYSMIPLSECEDKIFNSCKIYINNISKTEITNINFYTNLQNYLNCFNYNEHIASYNFSVKEVNYDTHGTINFSTIQDIYFELLLNKKINYQNPISIRFYSIYFNILEINNGICSLKYV